MISRKGVKGPSLLIYQTYSSYLYLYPTEKPDWRRRSGSHCQCSGNESNFDSLAPWCPFFFWRSILVLTNHAYFDFIQNNQIGEVGASKIGEALFSYHQNLISLNLEVSGSDFRCTTFERISNAFLTTPKRNHIGPIGAELIGEALRINQTLKELNMLVSRILFHPFLYFLITRILIIHNK